MKEKDFQSKFTNYIKEFWEGTAAFELKYAKGSRFSFGQIKPHQLVALRLTNHKKIVWKIEDSGYLRKPYDMFVIEKSPAFIVVMFEFDKKIFFLITIDEIDELISQGKKSITFDECFSLFQSIKI